MDIFKKYCSAKIFGSSLPCQREYLYSGPQYHCNKYFLIITLREKHFFSFRYFLPCRQTLMSIIPWLIFGALFTLTQEKSYELSHWHIWEKQIEYFYWSSLKMSCPQSAYHFSVHHIIAVFELTLQKRWKSSLIRQCQFQVDKWLYILFCFHVSLWRFI